MCCSKISTNKHTHTYTKTSKATSDLGSSHPSPRGRCYRRSGPVVPASLHRHHSTVWACPSPLHSPHMHPSLPPERMSPCAAPCRETPPGFSKWTGSVCKTPNVEEKNRNQSQNRLYWSSVCMQTNNLAPVLYCSQRTYVQKTNS